jgi:transcriptional regulator with XRE-family HTH domain
MAWGLHLHDKADILSPAMKTGMPSTVTALRSRAMSRAVADPGAVLAKATQRAAALLGLNGAALARVLGVSEATVSRVLRGERGLPPDSKEGELAALLVRLYRSLDALVGNDEERRLAWMRSDNDALHGKPFELIRTAQGLVATVAYLDAMRAPL